ncbi:outer arm dynein light chain 1 protein [Wolffia australiana]
MVVWRENRPSVQSWPFPSGLCGDADVTRWRGFLAVMAIVTGDRYLDSLVRFVERNAEPLVDGSLTLKLNPTGLRYVQSRLEALEELERLINGAPVDYLRAYVSDLGDHRALEQLRRILELLTSLKVISVLDPPSRDPTPLSLRPFARLKVLELRGCDLSSSSAKGLLELRRTLEKLICHNSTDALRHVFASRLVEINYSAAWKRLTFVSCACNGLILMDESLQLLPAVETLDLSRNRFAKLDNLRKCHRLSFLDLGFNQLRTVASLNEVICPIVKLVLRNNALTTLRGIENLRAVQGLDLSYNLLSTFSELEILASLPSLRNVWLEGNPICCARWYRGHFFSLFPDPERVKLDDKGISRGEYWERRAIIVGRRKRPAGHGFYIPVNMTADDGDGIMAARKRLSRLASIQDKKQAISSSSEDVDLEVKDDSADEESQITGLIGRPECMKKDQGDAENSERVRNSKTSFVRDKKVKVRKRPLPLKNFLNLSKADDFRDKSILKQPVENCDEPSSLAEVNEDTVKMQHLNSLDAIQDIISSRQSSLSSASPPQYRKDILHRRQNLEEKFLQISADPSFSTSSESRSGSSDDDSCDSIDSCFEHIHDLSDSEEEDLPVDASNGRIERLAGVLIEEDYINDHNTNQGFEGQIRGRMKLDERLDVLSQHESLLYTMQSIEQMTLNQMHDEIEKPLKDRVQNVFLEGRVSCLNDFGSQTGKQSLLNLKDNEVFGSWRGIVFCDWVLEEETSFRERRVAVLLSDELKVYVLLVNETHEGRGMIPRIVGCHLLDEIVEIVIGLESQALRVNLEDGVAYVFLTRSASKLDRLLSLFHAHESSGPNRKFRIKCWEQVQVHLFDQDICGGVKLSIYFYAVPKLYHNDDQGETWLSRSLFLVEGHLCLCMENLADFGKSPDEFSLSNPYFTLHSCWPIEGISKMEIETDQCNCLTMTLDESRVVKNSRTRRGLPKVTWQKPELTWRLRWTSKKALRSFVALIKGLHVELATSPKGR